MTSNLPVVDSVLRAGAKCLARCACSKEKHIGSEALGSAAEGFWWNIRYGHDI